MLLAGRSSLTALVAATAFGCSMETPISEVKGSCAEVFKAQVCTWAKTQGENLLEVGATVPLSAIENSPAEAQMVWPPAPVAVLDIPEAARKMGGLLNFTMYWEPHGHPPGAYLTPHFDFHFNKISSAERAAIDCTDPAKPDALPSAYVLPDIPLPPEMSKMIGAPALVGLCVPQMGMHAMPASELEAKEAFRATMIVGYAKGKPIFFEPMVAKAMLMEKRSFDLVVPPVPGMSGIRPTKFRAVYDAAKQEYRLSLSGFSVGG